MVEIRSQTDALVLISLMKENKAEQILDKRATNALLKLNFFEIISTNSFENH